MNLLESGSKKRQRQQESNDLVRPLVGVLQASAEVDDTQSAALGSTVLRWEPTRGETGPWSETASATIGA